MVTDADLPPMPTAEEALPVAMARIRELEAALTKYGDHLRGCCYLELLAAEACSTDPSGKADGP